LEEASKPYSGATIRVVGEALPPLETLAKLAPEFEKTPSMDVEVEAAPPRLSAMAEIRTDGGPGGRRHVRP
jgi:hypothetical protein